LSPGIGAKLARRPMSRRIAKRPILVALLLAFATTILLAACGGSSKPGYCSSVNNLKTSVQDLGKVNPVQNGTNSVKSALQKVQSNATSVVDSAKSDFPSQTTAIDDAVSALETTAKLLASNPKQPQLIAQIPGQVKALTSAVDTFINDTKSKCS
jgi:hypothetical protein